jgi:hypothetical protein
MSAVDLSSGAGRRRSVRWRALTVAVLLVAIVVPYTVTLIALWTRTGGDEVFAQHEQAGITILRPLVRLVAATADTQTSAIAGGTIDVPRIRASLAEMDSADGQVGGTLATHQRWADLRGRINDTVLASPQGPSAYAAYTQLTDLEYALVEAVGDASNLILDPQLDSYYLVDTLLRVPELVVESGRVADIAQLSQQHEPTGRDDTTVAAVANAQVGSQIASIDDGLSKSFAATRSQTLGPALLSQLDQLRDTAATLSPPASAVGSAPVSHSAQDVQSARARLRDAGLAIEQAGLDQLGLLLQTRVDALVSTRRLVGALTVVGLVIAAAAAWVRAPRRRPVAPDGIPDAGPLGDDRSVRDGHGRGSGDTSPFASTSDPHTADLLAAARDLVPAGDPARVGRAAGPMRDDR